MARKNMELHTLPKTVSKRTRRLGRGSGSGRGKTAGRGTKGQKARDSIKVGFEGGQLPLIKRLPLYRGRGRNKVKHKKPFVVNLKFLAGLPKNTVVTMETLVKYKLVKASDVAQTGVKILGGGEVTQALTISLPISKSAAVKIEKAGGKIEKMTNA